MSKVNNHNDMSISRKLLNNLRETLAKEGDGQKRLDRIVNLVSQSMNTHVCSIYLCRDQQTLELCATKGLKLMAVHKTRMRIGEGLVGNVALKSKPINTENASNTKGFHYIAGIGEKKYNAFLGVPIQRLGEILGVLVVQDKKSQLYSDDQIYALEIVAMVIAEMKELGAFIGDGAAMSAPRQRPYMFQGISAQEGLAIGHVLLYDPKIIISNFVADNLEVEKDRLNKAMDKLRLNIDNLLNNTDKVHSDQKDILKAYRMVANSKSWMNRLKINIEGGLTAELAVEKEQSATRSRMERIPDPYLRERLNDLDDLSNRLLRLLTGQKRTVNDPTIKNPILVANNIGPTELLEYGKTLKAIVLEQGSVGSHATIIARAWGIPMVIQAYPVTREALNGDMILVNGDSGLVNLRPIGSVKCAFKDKLVMQTAAQQKYAAIRTQPATTCDGINVEMQMNAGLLVDLPSLKSSGAEGVGLFRTELQFLTGNAMPKRKELASLYARALNAAGGLPVTFRTLDIGSDKVLSYMQNISEPNPAMGWRAIRMGLDKPGMMKMQLQALLRSANGRPLKIMFPFIAQFNEFRQARAIFDNVVKGEKRLNHIVSDDIEIGAMLETPSLAFAPAQFFQVCDFISIGGNDLKQFFYAADRQNERVRRRYDTLNVSFLSFIEQIAARCDQFNTPVSFCGEDAGRPLIALCLVAMGLRSLSMRPASIGPVKHALRSINLQEIKAVINVSRASGVQSVRGDVIKWLKHKHSELLYM